MFKLNRFFVSRVLLTATMLIATMWLINHSIIGEYLNLGEYYLSQYLSGEHTQEAEAGEMLMHMGFTTVMTLIALFLIWTIKIVGEEKVLILTLTTMAFVSAIVVFYKESYGFDVLYLSDTPWIWVGAIGSVAIILAEAYFLLVRPIRKQT